MSAPTSHAASPDHAVLAIAPLDWPARIGLAAIGPVAGVPGLIWSVARYRRFEQGFLNRVLRRRVDDMDRELQHARRLHESLLPAPIDGGPVLVRYRYEPMRAIGGDFLTLRRTPAGCLIALIVDVTGHGIPAALAVNRLHGEIDRFLAERPEARPGELLAALNRYAGASLAPQGMSATAICFRVDPTDGTIAWSNAGHPPAILLRAGSSAQLMSSGGCMLGVLDPPDFDAPEETLELRSGDRIFGYTDGATEAADSQGRMFGLDGIVGAMGSTDDPCGALALAISRFRSGPARDDMLAMEIRFVGTGAA